MKTTHFTITRSRWSGVDPKKGSSLLERVTKRQCCLGFYCSAIGIKETEIESWGSVSGLIEGLYPLSPPEEIQWLGAGEYLYLKGSSTSKEDKLMTLNDSSMPLPEKEEEIAAIFAANGITVTFED